MLTLQLGDLLGLGDHSPVFLGGWGGWEGDIEVRLEPQKSWAVTRTKTPSKTTSSRNKSREADAETDEDLKGWGDGYIR